MKMARREFTQEFKQKAVTRMQSDECSVEQLARELENSGSTSHSSTMTLRIVALSTRRFERMSFAILPNSEC